MLFTRTVRKKTSEEFDKAMYLEFKEAFTEGEVVLEVKFSASQECLAAMIYLQKPDGRYND